MILRTEGMEKYCEKLEDMKVGLKNWQDLKDHFSQVCRHYQVRNKATAEAHGCGASSNHTQETYSQVNTIDAL